MRFFNFLRNLFLFLILVLSAQVNALEVDESLTFRILKLSSSKKTLLMNRGTDDGLKKDNHAKFFLTATGVVGRGVISRISPTRSVWSVYRLVNESEVIPNRILQLKVVPPVKLTADSTKMMASEQTVSPTGGGADDADLRALQGIQGTDGEIPEGVQVEGRGIGKEYVRNLDTRDDSRADGRGVSGFRTLEFFGTLSLSSLSSSQDDGSDTTTDSTETLVQVSAGIEKYFTSTIARRISFFVGLDLSRSSVSNDTAETESTLTKTGGSTGVNWHFLNDPLLFNHFIPFLGFTFGLGNENTSSSQGTSSTTTSSTYNTLTIGGGVKFYTKEGFGLRAMLDYYRKSSELVNEIDDSITNTVTSGPRLLVGASYRW